MQLEEPVAERTRGVGRLRLDLGLALLLFIASLALRIPYLTLVPPLWNSEVSEALDGLDIALGQSVPLMLPSQPHIGPVVAYPLAFALRVFGSNPFLPRYFVALAGALTVVATYLLARTWGGRLAGLIAGALLATNPFHITVNSHYFWTNSVTPLITTLSLFAFVMAMLRRSPAGWRSGKRWLVLAVFLFGLALQTHPSVLGLAPGLALWWLTRRSPFGSLRDRWSWLAIGAGVLGYANVILFNLITGFRSVAVASSKAYTLPEGATIWTEFPLRLLKLSAELLWMVSSNLSEERIPDLPTAMLMLGFGAALLWAWKTKRRFFLFATISSALVVGYGNKVYGGG